MPAHEFCPAQVWYCICVSVPFLECYWPLRPLGSAVLVYQGCCWNECVTEAAWSRPCWPWCESECCIGSLGEPSDLLCLVNISLSSVTDNNRVSPKATKNCSTQKMYCFGEELHHWRSRWCLRPTVPVVWISCCVSGKRNTKYRYVARRQFLPWWSFASSWLLWRLLTTDTTDSNAIWARFAAQNKIKTL